jgi:hypothetical protein
MGNNTAMLRKLTPALSPYVQAHIEDTARDLKPLVDKIEASPMMTRGHYGRYLSILSQFSDKTARRICYLAILDCGANRDGAADAMVIIEGPTDRGWL